MRKNIFIFLFLVSNLSFSQTFETIIYPREDYDFEPIYSIILNNYTYILAYEHPISSNSLLDADTQLLKLDSLGNLINSFNLSNLVNTNYRVRVYRKFFKFNNHLYLYGTILNSEAIGNPNVTGYDNYAYLLCLREDLSIKFFRTYLNPGIVTNLISVIPLNNNQLIANINGYNTSYINGLYTIDPENGQEQFVKEIETCGTLGNLLEIPAYNRLHSLQSWPSNSNICSFDLTNFSIADSVGRFFSLKYNRVMPALELINDSMYLLAVTFDKPKNNQQTEFSCHLALQYVKYDLSVIDSVEMQMHKDTTFENFVVKNFDIIDSANIYWGGSYNYKSTIPIPFNLKTNFLLDKYNIISKQRIWRKIYKQNETFVQYKLNTVHTTNDKGCLMIGYRWDFNPINNPENKINRAVYILRVDSMGNNYNEWVNIQKTSVSENREILLFPNPNSNKILSITGFKAGDKLYIYNMQGQLIKSVPVESKIDLSEMSSGIYILSVLSESGEVIKNDKLILQ